MTTPSTGDAMGESLPDEVVEAVARAIMQDVFERGIGRAPEWGSLFDSTREIWRHRSRAAIEAYRKAMREEG